MWGQREGPRELAGGRERGPRAKRQVGEVVRPREGRSAGLRSESTVDWTGVLEDRSAIVGLGEPEPVDGRTLPHQVGRWKWPDPRDKVCPEVCALGQWRLDFGGSRT